jgi:glycine cleavage system H protein
MLPKNLKYNKQVWVELSGDVATLGLTDYGLKAAKELVFIDLPKKGQKLKKGETFVSIESIKWSGHIDSPLSGEVTDVNEALFDDPAKMNKEPYKSWICKATISDNRELDDLLSAEEAAKFV